MRDQSLTKLASRSAGAFVLAWSVQLLGGGWIPALNGSGMTRSQAVTWGVVTAAVGIGILLAPWERWRPTATVAIAIVIVPLMSAVAWDTRFAAGKDTPSPEAAIFMVLAWVAVTQPRWYPSFFAPYIGVVYGGVLLATPDTRVSIYSLPTVVVMAAMLAEVIGWMKDSVLKAQLVERQRLNDVQTLTSTLSRLRGVPIEDAAEVIGLAAGDLFRCGRSTVVLRGIEIDPTLTTYRTGGRVPREEAMTILAAADTGVDGRVRVERDAEGTIERLCVTLGTPGDEIAGVVVADIDDEPDGFTVHVARLFSAEVGTAVEQLEAVEALAQKALFDELTGIGNRRLASELLDSLRPGDGVLLIDVDDFKRVNDSDGHAAGDEVLRALGRHLRSAVRGGEEVARIGGDEFVVVSRAGVEDAVEVARTIHDSWASSAPLASISIGVALHPAGGDPSATLEHADIALYTSKSLGRDCVNVYDTPGGHDARTRV